MSQNSRITEAQIVPSNWQNWASKKLMLKFSDDQNAVSTIRVVPLPSLSDMRVCCSRLKNSAHSGTVLETSYIKGLDSIEFVIKKEKNPQKQHCNHNCTSLPANQNGGAAAIPNKPCPRCIGEEDVVTISLRQTKVDLTGLNVVETRFSNTRTLSEAYGEVLLILMAVIEDSKQKDIEILLLLLVAVVLCSFF